MIYYKIYNKRKNNNFDLVQLKKQFTNPSLNERVTKKEKFLRILLISFIDFTTTICSTANFFEGIFYLNCLSMEMIFYSLISYLILRIKLYKHHYACIVIVVIFDVLFDLILDNFSQGNILGNLLNYLFRASLTLYYISFKFIMLKKYIKSYEILPFEGLIELIFAIITLIITTNIG